MNKDLIKYKQIILQSSDQRMNYTIMKKHQIENMETIPDILDSSSIDYGIKVTDGDKSHLDGFIPLSILNINTLSDAEEWYKNKYPNLPDEYWSIMAKYHCDQPFTKKQLRNEVKKLNKKGKSKELSGLKIVHQKFKIDFS